LLAPAWLLLLAPLLLALWRWPPGSTTGRVLRSATYAAVVLALARLAVLLPGAGGTVVVLADRSESLPADAAARQLEAIASLRDAMRPGDRLGVVSFAAGAALELPPGREPFAGFGAALPSGASELAAGLERAAAALPPAGAAGGARLLVLSDGRWSGEDPADVAARLALRGVAVDHLLLARGAAGDFAVARLDAPAQDSPGEAFVVTAWVWSPRPAEVEVALEREVGPAAAAGEPAAVLASGRRQLAAGLNPVVFHDRVTGAGQRAYRVTLRPPPGDPEPANDAARFLVQARGRRPVLVVRERRDDGGLPALLRAGGVDAVSVPPARLQAGIEVLAGAAAVVLEDQPASGLGEAGLTALARWVEEGGGGLLITGGRGSFGGGGYFGSALAPVLPVSMELRREHRKLTLAMVLALDRSGSMAVPVAEGRTKMDLANLGAATVVDLLSPLDQLAVHAVDSSVHRVVPLAALADPDGVRQRVLRIESAGGGIFVGAALEAAASELMGATAGTRHVILFADAADAEEPGEYQDLLGRMRQAGMTVSVVGLGTEGDVDAELLRDIARRGGGQVYFTEDPASLPRLFAQDTVTVARSAFVEERTPLRALPGLRLLAGRELGAPPPAGGYNLTYLRPGATLGIVTADEYRAPLVATWQAGLGRSAALTAQLDGPWSGELSRWPRLGELVTSLVRWVAGEEGELPGGAVLTQQLAAGAVTVTLHLDPDRAGDGFAAAPRVVALRGTPGRPPTVTRAPLEWTGPDTLAATLPLAGAEVATLTVEVPGAGVRSLAPLRLPVPPELVPAPVEVGARELRRLSRLTGGRERTDPAGIWAAFPRRAQRVELAPWLLLIAAATLLLEVARRRLPGRWWPARLPGAAAPARRWERRLRQGPIATPVTPPSPGELPSPARPQEPSGPAPPRGPATAPEVEGALAAARRRVRDRLGR
jgi:Mg-chelatase subunit ChlD